MSAMVSRLACVHWYDLLSSTKAGISYAWVCLESRVGPLDVAVRWLLAGRHMCVRLDVWGAGQGNR